MSQHDSFAASVLDLVLLCGALGWLRLRLRLSLHFEPAFAPVSDFQQVDVGHLGILVVF